MPFLTQWLGKNSKSWQILWANWRWKMPSFTLLVWVEDDHPVERFDNVKENHFSHLHLYLPLSPNLSVFSGVFPIEPPKFPLPTIMMGWTWLGINILQEMLSTNDSWALMQFPKWDNSEAWFWHRVLACLLRIMHLSPLGQQVQKNTLSWLHFSPV